MNSQRDEVCKNSPLKERKGNYQHKKKAEGQKSVKWILILSLDISNLFCT